MEHSSKLPVLTLLAAFSGVGVLSGRAAFGQSFTQVSVPGFEFVIVPSLSADGAQGAGYGFGDATNGRFQAFRWNLGSTPTVFGSEPHVRLDSRGTAISGNGQVVVGYAGNTTGGRERPFRWSGTGTYQELSTAGYQGARATSTSFDGAITVGYLNLPTQNVDSYPCMWNVNGTEFDLPSPSIGQALDVSGNGSTIIGDIITQTGVYGVMWDSTRQYIPLTPLLPNDQTLAQAVNFDGSIIVGTSGASNATDRAVIWHAGQVLELLGPQGEHLVGGANGVSDDGSIVLGGWQFASTPHGTAGVWTQATGATSLYDYLTSNGLVLPSDIVFNQVNAISGDGNTFAGLSSNYGAFVATIPAPGAALVGVGALAHAARRRRR